MQRETSARMVSPLSPLPSPSSPQKKTTGNRPPPPPKKKLILLGEGDT